jgi:transposase
MVVYSQVGVSDTPIGFAHVTTASEAPMDFPITDLMDEGACYARLVAWLHPDGLACPRCHQHDGMGVHSRARGPMLDFRCDHCGRVFNALTDTALHGLRRRPSELVLIVRGFAQGVPTAQLARELDCDRSELLNLRHRLQDLAFVNRDFLPLDDPVLEGDETYQNAGEKGVPHLDPEDPPRRRGNAAPGHGTWANDRPPVCGVVGRESGEIRLTVTERSNRETLDIVVRRASWPMATVYTDDWCGYNGLPKMGRLHATVCHEIKEWARDDDGDGIREVHNNTLEGLWTGLRNFLRPFRGVNKIYLYQYVCMFEWSYNIKRVTDAFAHALLGVRSAMTVKIATTT